MHAQVMWNTISNAPPCSGFLARENQEKAWTDILYKEEVKEITRLLVSPARASIKVGGQGNVSLLDRRGASLRTQGVTKTELP